MNISKEQSKLRRFGYFVGLQALFIAIGIVIYWLVLHGHVFWAGSRDDIFHWGRLEEVSQSLLHGHWPAFDAYSSYLGLATPSFYPWESLVPISIVRWFCSPLLTIRIYIISVFVTGMDCAYYASLSYWHKRYQSLLFAMLCSITSSFVMPFIKLGEFSEVLAFAFIPLAVFGWLHAMRDNKWKMLAIGMTLMLFTHLLASVMVATALLIMTILSCNRLRINNILAMAKALLTTVMTTACVWLPLYVLNKDNFLYGPKPFKGLEKFTYIAPKWYITNLMRGRVYSILTNNSFIYCIGITDILAVILGIFCFLKLSYYGKRFFIVSLILFSLNLPNFPWKMLDTTKLAYLQFPYRLCFLAHALLIIAVMPLIYREVRKHVSVDLFVSLLIIVSACLCTWDVNFIVQRASHYITRYDKHGWSIGHQQTWTNQYLNSPIAINRSYNMDYANQPAVSRFNHKFRHMDVAQHNYGYSYELRKQEWNNKLIPNGFIMNKKHAYYNYHLPIMIYSGQDYHFYLDGKRITPERFNWSNPVVKRIPAGRHVITYSAPMMNYRKISIVLSCIGGLILLVPVDVVIKNKEW